jgi:hypothetical protein
MMQVATITLLAIPPIGFIFLVLLLGGRRKS